MRPLTSQEISMLERNGCRALSGWGNLSVGDTFDASRCSNVTFDGKVAIKGCAGEIEIDGIRYPAGIYNAYIHECTIGEGVHISNVGDVISRYSIGRGALIRDVGSIRSEEGANSWIGMGINVLVEHGDRYVTLHPDVTAQTAYLMAMYRHDRELQEALRELYPRPVGKTVSKIGIRAVIRSCVSISDTNIGNYATIENCRSINDSTICSSRKNSTYLSGVTAIERSVVQENACLRDGVIVKHSLIGRYAAINDGATIHNSVICSNSRIHCGEVVASFIGPLSTSMHKSTLLIGGLFSFFNAGSGTNQSNHMYKLGPVHQGILERGCKTGSDAYVAWPARIGAFTLVMGRHYSHPDTHQFPFSYLVNGKNGESVLIPAMNIVKIGTARDDRKWSDRNQLTPSDPDCVTTSVYTPLTVGLILDAIDTLKILVAESDGTIDLDEYTMSLSAARRAINLYSMAVEAYFYHKFFEIDRAEVKPRAGKWIDVAGLVAPKEEVDKICDEICRRRMNARKISEAFHALTDPHFEQEWILAAVERYIGIKVDTLADYDLDFYCQRWGESAESIVRMQQEDASTDYPILGYGIDHPDFADIDLYHVRGYHPKFCKGTPPRF